MAFRPKRIFLLSAAAILLALSILDVTLKKLDVFEDFGMQFINGQKMEANFQARRGVQSTGRQQVDIERQAIQEVALAVSRSHVTVQRALSSGIRLELKVTASAANTEEADRKRDAVQVNQQVTNGRLTLTVTKDGKPVDPDSITLDYVLSVPDGLKLVLENEGGTARIEGLQADADVTSDRALTEIVNVSGKLTVNSSFGTLLMSGIQGSVNLENRTGDATIEDVQGPLALNGSSGHTFISRIAGKVTGTARNGAVHLRDIAWPVELTSEAAALQLEHIRNDLKVTAVAGSILLLLPEAEGYALHASVTRGNIRTHLPFPIDKGDTGAQLNGVLGQGTWKVDIDAAGTDIEVLKK